MGSSGDGEEEDVMFVGKDGESIQLLEFLRMIQRTTPSDMGASPLTANFPVQPAGYRWEVNALEKGDKGVGLSREEERAYGGRLGFPTTRRPESYQRQLAKTSKEVEIWAREHQSMIGDAIKSEEERRDVERLLFTWRDLFVVDPEVMPVTDLVMHTIPTYDHIRPIRMKDRLYSPKEVQWQRENIPRLLKAGVISYCDSPWSAGTKHPVKRDGSLRMVNIFCPINSATIKSNYPMKRIEPVVNLLSQEKYKRGPKFQADATNGYYAIPLWHEHAYKTAFSCSLGQFCYNVMGQGLSGAPHTYSRLKDIAMGSIPEPAAEEALHGETRMMESEGEVAFEYFMDDDFGAATDFQTLYLFLHEKYFPRVDWARLTLKPKKTRFFSSSMDLLGYELKDGRLRPSIDKVAKIRDFPVPRNETELNNFLYMTTYLKRFIPGRADHAQKMKEAVNKGTKKGKGTQVADWKWGEAQQQAFEAVKTAILNNATTGGDANQQYHLSCDASGTGLGAVLFQLTGVKPGTVLKDTSQIRIVMFISQRLSEVEQRYLNTEREALSVLRALEEVRWLVVGSPYPVKVYTDHSALLSILRGEGSHQGRISSWMMRLSEYTVEYHHVKGSENKLADGLSRMRIENMSEPRETRDDWEDVMVTEVTTIEGDQRWASWIEDPWYGDIVRYLSTGKLKGEEKETRRTKRKATRYRLAMEGEDSVYFLEVTGEWARCVKKEKVDQLLYRYHDLHGHFARDMTLRMLRGRYYWPTRVQDVVMHVKSCDACQRFGPIKIPNRPLKTVLNLQPMDMLGMDFVGPIRPASKENKYVLIVVDYFSRYVFVSAEERADGAVVTRFLTKIAHFMGWPKAIYCDNASYFVKGVVPELLRSKSVLLFPAPVTHPSSVGLAEKYVNLLMTGLRSTLQGRGLDLSEWGSCLPTVAFAINTRTVRVHGFTPAQLLFGFTPRGYPEDFSIRDGLIAHTGLLEETVVSWANERGYERWEEDKEKGDQGGVEEEEGLVNGVWSRLSTMEEERDMAIERMMCAQKAIEAQYERKHSGKPQRNLSVGDLVLLRRFAVDKDKGKKLDTKWEGPYKVTKIGRSGVSMTLEDLHTGKRKGSYSLDHVKEYVKRGRSQNGQEEVLLVAMKDIKPTLVKENGYWNLW